MQYPIINGELDHIGGAVILDTTSGAVVKCRQNVAALLETPAFVFYCG